MIDGFDWKNPDYRPIYEERAKRLRWLRKNPQRLPGLRTYYRDNIAQFINDWGMTTDPRNAEVGRPVLMPFILFPRQAEWIDWLLERWKSREPGLTEKSRDMGLSWLEMAVAGSLCCFYQDINIGVGSRKEEYVDKSDDPKSLFYKARQFISLLPGEFTGNWNARKHSSHMLIKLPHTRSTITGEAGVNIGRGNRASIYMKDESAFYERPQLIDASLSQTANCRIDISTPNGNGNPFYQKRFSGKIKVFTFRWREDPRKDDAWYQKQLNELDPVTVAQEIDIDYTASIEGVCIPGKWVQAAINLHEKIGLVPSGLKRCALDVADEEGRDLNVIIESTGTVMGEIESWKGLDTYQTGHKAAHWARDIGASYVNYDSIGVGAGVRGAVKSVPIPFYPIATSTTDVHGYVLDNPTILNRDYYKNLRAQLWWEMRIRCQRAYQHLNGIREWSLDEMISLPNHPTLISELSQPLVFYSEDGSGKIQLESKQQMKKRGLSSPNYADAAVMLFAPVKLERHYTMQQPISPGAWT